MIQARAAVGPQFLRFENAKPGRPARLSVVVVNVLADEIITGRYPSGSLLPPEPVLCQSFDVSRGRLFVIARGGGRHQRRETRGPYHGQAPRHRPALHTEIVRRRQYT